MDNTKSVYQKEDIDTIQLQAHSIVYNIINRIRSFPIIDSISLSINEEEIVGILGPNGCGKSTLLRLLTGLESPTSGTIHYSNKAFKIGMIFQHVQQNLVPWRTVLDNIALPAILAKEGRDIAITKAKAALSEMRLNELAERYPHEISGGQQQLVNLARWLSNPPSILFVDEGWSMLDLVQRQRAYEILKNLASLKGCSVCVVSHNIPELAGVADRVLILTERPARVAKEVDLSSESSSIKRSERLWEATKSIFNTSSMG